jgi:hypothetical protein
MNDMTRRKDRGLGGNGGKFATSMLSESDVSLADVPFASETEPDLTRYEPAEIDEQLASLYYERAKAEHRRDSTYDHLSGEIARRVFNRGWRGSATRDEVAQALTEIDESPEPSRDYQQKDFLKQWERVDNYQAQIDDLTMEMRPYEEEFDRRGGWTRAFLVTNAQGHVHKDMRCSTCRPTTQYHWVTDMSGKVEDEIVDAAGERACTVCYPSAPVETLNKPTRLFTPDEVEKKKAAEERAAAKMQRDADKIAKGLTPDGSEFKVEWTEVSGGFERNPQTGLSEHVVKPRGKREFFKTERAATTWLVQDMAWNKDRSEVVAARADAYDSVVEAIAVKHNRSREDVWAEIDKKVAAKRKRDGYTD